MEPTETNGPRPWSVVRDGLQQPIPGRLLETKEQGGTKITFCPWYRVQKILDHYTGGWWEKRVTEKRVENGQFLITIEVTIITAEGRITREGTGIESTEVDSWGDFSSNAESMAFRRACAAFGLGIELYEGKR